VTLTPLCASARAQFETRGISEAPLSPVSVAVGDFNHDGKLDIAVASLYSQQSFGTTIQVLIGNGDGTFQKAVSYTVGVTPVSVATADLNGDGNLDLVVLNGTSDNISVLLGKGDGTFLPAVNYNTPPGPIFVTTEDFNGDGKIDLVTVDLGDGTGNCACVAILLGNGDGTFQSPIKTTTATTPFAIGVGDFNADGHLDLAVAESFSSADQVEILLGNGDGTFRHGQIESVGAEPSSIAVSDFNGDHNFDLAVAENEGESVGVLLGNGDGTFRREMRYPTNFPVWVAAADLNGDGRSDLVVANIAFPNAITVFMGNGDGTFQRPTLYPVGFTNRFVAVGDFNGDHKPDIVFTASGTSYVEVLLNTGAVSFSPATPLNFKNQSVGTTSAPLTVKLTNTAKSLLKLSSMKATGQFGMSSTCGESVPSGATCTINVTFSPKTKGAKAGAITINDSASSKPQVIEPGGTGD
jgi:hypothetical protein